MNNLHSSHVAAQQLGAIAFMGLFKGPEHGKDENLYFLAPTQTKLMQPISVSRKVPFRSNLQKTFVQWESYWSSEGHDPLSSAKDLIS